MTVYLRLVLAARHIFTPPIACGCELEGWGVVDRLEARGAVRPSDLEAPLAAGGSSRSFGQLEASPR